MNVLGGTTLNHRVELVVWLATVVYE